MRTRLRLSTFNKTLALLLLTLCVASQTAGGRAGNASYSDPTAGAEPPSTAAAQDRTIKLRLLVTGPDGNPVGGARVNVWHDLMGPDTLLRPADYQRDETNVDGLAEIDVMAGKSSGVIIEVNKGELARQVILDLSLARQVTLKFPDYILSRTIQLQPRDRSNVDEGHLVKIKVQVESETEKPGEKGEPIGGARVAFRYLGSSSRVAYEGVTGPEGDLLLSVPATSYSIEATKEGYSQGTTRVSTNINDAIYRKGRPIVAPTIRLKKRTGKGEAKEEAKEKPKVKVIFEVRNAETGLGVSGAEIVLTGKAGITSGVYIERTNPDGLAEITLGEYGRFDLQISQQYFEAHNGEVRILVGENEKNLGPILLKEKPKKEEAGDLVYFTVLAGDKKNAPIEGAHVTVGGKSTFTNADGQATISTPLGESFVVAKAAAKGYRSQSKTVPVRRGVVYTDASATATIVLQPGEDAATEDAPITLIVEVRDATDNKPIKGAAVDFLAANGDFLYVGGTNTNGERDFISGPQHPPLSVLRQGLKLDIKSQGYKEIISRSVPASLLQPSAEPRRFLVAMERDWADLITAIGALEGKVAAWNNDVREASAKGASAREQAGQVALAKKRVEALLEQLESFRAPVVGFVGPGVPTRCTRATLLKQRIQGYEGEARQKEQELRQRLDEAAALAARCASPGEADSIKRSYQAAIRLAGEIGAIQKKAVREADELAARWARESETVKLTLKEAEDVIRRLDVEERAAEALVKQVGADLLRSSTLSRGLAGRHDALTAELQALKGAHGLDRFMTGLPPDLKRRLAEMEELLGSRNSDVFSVPDTTLLDGATRSAAQIRALREDAEKTLADYRNWAACEIKPMDDVAQNINSIQLGTVAELGAAANLPNKAEECARRGACQPLLASVRPLLEEDSIEAAAAKINDARAKGCDVTEAESELDYFRTVRQTANLLLQSLQNCRFQEALKFSEQFPPLFKSRPLVAQALAVVQRGLQAQRRVAQLRESARREVDRTRQMASAHPYVAEAEQIAAPFPCLVREVAGFRSGYPGNATGNQKPTDEVPGALGENKAKKENPTDEIPTALGGLTGTLGSSRPPFRPPGETKPGSKTQQPTDEVPGALGSNTGRPPVRDDSSKQPGGNTEDKPIDQNWTGTWTRPDGIETVSISGSGNSISASFRYQGSGYSGSGQWTNCSVNGNTAKCSFTANHDDDTKSGSRKGTLEMTLSGDGISGRYLEDTPQWNYKAGYGPHNVFSVFVKGAVFPVSYKRR